MGESPDLLFTVTRDNIHHLAPMAEFARELGLMLIINPVFATKMSTPETDLMCTIERYTSSPFVYINKAFHQLRREGGNDIKFPRCRVIDAAIVISPENQLLLPCFHFQQIKMTLKEKERSVSYNHLKYLRQTPTWQYYHNKQGRFNFCQGCHLNCYFDPSFFYKLDALFWQSLLAKSRYARDKYLRRKKKGKSNIRSAIDTAAAIVERYDFLAA